MTGKGELLITGQLGDVMRESAYAALSYIRSRAEELLIDPNFQDSTDLHIHMPENALPKMDRLLVSLLRPRLFQRLLGVLFVRDLQ